MAKKKTGISEKNTDEKNNATKTKWGKFIEPFATTIDKSPEDVGQALKSLIGDPGDDAIKLLQNENYTPLDEIQKALSDVPVAKLRMAVEKIRKEEKSESSSMFTAGQGSYDILPSVPDDNSFLEMLKTGGILKVDNVDVIAAIRAALANKTQLFEIPNVLVRKMEQFAEEQEEPCSEEFYLLRKTVAERNYAEVLSALNVNGNIVSKTRKDNLLEKIDSLLWNSIKLFQDQLQGWVSSWQQGAANPGNMMLAFTQIAQGGKGSMPPGMMTPPDTSPLRDASDTVIDNINKIFAGMGIPIARALAWDANNIKKTLENSSLPAQVGAANKEQMLKSLGVNVTSDYVRLERNITRYTLSIMEFKDVSSGDSEIAYLSALFQLGSAIPWEIVLNPKN